MKELVAETVDYGAELGVHGERFSAGSFSQAAFVTVKVSMNCRVYFRILLGGGRGGGANAKY